MRLLCFKGSLLLLLLVFAKVFALNVAFYYKEDVPESLLRFYDWVVVIPTEKTLKASKKYIHKTFAYLSIGETLDEDVPDSWVLGENKNWNTKVLDITDASYRQFLLNKIKRLREQGINGFFFDTLDSYKLVLPKEKWDKYEEGLISFIKQVKLKYPEVKIILNRGFEIFDDVYRYIDAVVAEGLFQGYDGKQFVKVSQSDRKWLLDKLNYIKSKNIPVVVIDYLPVKERKKALNLAKQIRALGFIPYITDKDLSTIGISDIEIYPREVLVIYTTEEDVAYSEAHRLIQMPLEYLGYNCRLVKPEEAVKISSTVDRYAGIVVWLENDLVKNYDAFYRWILDRINEGSKVLFIGYFGFPLERRYLSALDLEVKSSNLPIFSRVSTVYKDENVVGFEDKEPFTTPERLIVSKNSKPLLVQKTENGELFHPVAITKWGGYVLPNYHTVSILETTKWIVEPFELLKLSLRLNDFPKPDFTTENGMRVLFSHIDGDGSVSLSEIYAGKFAMEVIRDEVLKKYDIPIGVSFIEGEIMPYGAYPQYSKEAVEIAKSIFALKNVEPASHTFSHPYKWIKLYELSKENYEEIPEGYNLKIKGYRFSLYREIVQSCKNLQKLAPPDKKVNIIYWSGDCVPPYEALKIAYENGILNINNGDTYITEEFPYLSYIAPAGLRRGEYYQIYDAQQNENVYTYEFSRDYWRYKKVIETFKLTDKPKRLKPIDIYYHFYSGVKHASLSAVKEAYNWALSQEVIPLKVSEYIKKVLDFYTASVARKKDFWLIKTDKNVRTLRVNLTSGYPDLNKSKGVIGYYVYNDQIYIHLDGSGDYRLYFTEQEPDMVYIKQSNARVLTADKNFFHLKGYVPVKVVFGNFENCKVVSKNKFKIKNDTVIFNEKEVRFEVDCN